MMYERINYWASMYASVACIVFVVVYSTITPWWKTPTGRLIMMLIFGLAGLASLSIWFSAYRDLDMIRAIRAGFVLLVGTALWAQVIALVVVQRKGRRKVKPGKSHGRHRA